MSEINTIGVLQIKDVRFALAHVVVWRPALLSCGVEMWMQGRGDPITFLCSDREQVDAMLASIDKAVARFWESRRQEGPYR